MNSLRTRVFVTVAIVLAASTMVSGLLSRRATLVEERQTHLVERQRPPAVDDVWSRIDRAYVEGGWRAARDVMRDAEAVRGFRLLALDPANKPVAASAARLEDAEVLAATGDGALSLRTSDGGTVARLDLRGIPTHAVRDAAGAAAGRIYLLPAADDREPPVRRPLVPWWVTTTVITTSIALLLTFALSGKLLTPVVERLEQTERQKRQLISDVAHELRSPVTNLRCELEAMQDGLLPLDRARVDALHGETLLLQRLIADLQDLALADAGGLSLHVDRVDVGEIARRAAGSIASGPRVTVTVEPAVLHVLADAARLEQMLRNLVSNARRHTPDSGRIEIRAGRDGEARVRISVADTGSGIAADHLPHVFDRFYRVDQSRDRATGGAGLGLAIVRRLAEAHGGTALAESAGEGRGAMFTIELPAPP
jgi:signal transduction histidine kinase